MIEITYLTPIVGYNGSCEWEYLIKFSKPMRLRDFIEELLKERSDEWGYFGIRDNHNTALGNPQWEYRYGSLITPPKDELSNRTIKSVTGSGAWSRSDYWFELEDE